MDLKISSIPVHTLQGPGSSFQINSSLRKKLSDKNPAISDFVIGKTDSSALLGIE